MGHTHTHSRNSTACQSWSLTLLIIIIINIMYKIITYNVCVVWCLPALSYELTERNPFAYPLLFCVIPPKKKNEITSIFQLKNYIQPYSLLFSIYYSIKKKYFAHHKNHSCVWPHFYYTTDHVIIKPNSTQLNTHTQLRKVTSNVCCCSGWAYNKQQEEKK